METPNTNTTKPSIHEAGRALYDAHQALVNLGIPFILDGGTLLGFYRDGTFCEDDQDDIDLTVHSKHADKVQQIIDGMVARGYTLYHKWERDEANHRSAQIAVKSPGGVKVDIMFKEFKQETGKAWWTVYGGPKRITYKAVPAELLAKGKLHTITVPIRPGQVADLTLGIPEKTEEYLAYRYGKWKVKVHRSKYSCYNTDLSIIEPNTYENI